MSKPKQNNKETSVNTNQGVDDSDKNQFKTSDEETNTVAFTNAAGIEDSSTIGKTNPYALHAQQLEQQPSSNTNQSDSDKKPASLFDQMNIWGSFNNTNDKQHNNDFNKEVVPAEKSLNRNQSPTEKKKPASFFKVELKFG